MIENWSCRPGISPNEMLGPALPEGRRMAKETIQRRMSVILSISQFVYHWLVAWAHALAVPAAKPNKRTVRISARIIPPLCADTSSD